MPAFSVYSRKIGEMRYYRQTFMSISRVAENLAGHLASTLVFASQKNGNTL